MSPEPGLAAAVDRLAGARVLCVGDVMLDRFVYGHVDRISPEAPIPVLRIDRERAMLGGAGNVVRNLVSLGAAVEFVSVVGKDPAGHEVMRLVGDLARVEPHLLVDAARPTTIKTRYIADGHQMLRADRETSAPVAAETGRDVVRIVEQSMVDCDVLVLSDYAKGVLTDENTRAMLAAARKAGKKAVIDPKGPTWARYKGAAVLTPNRHELAEAAGLPTDELTAIDKAGRKMIRALGLEAVLCTRGREGMALVRARGKPAAMAASAREVFDVSGAGDTVIATFAAGLAAGLAMEDAAQLANAAAGVVVGKVGTAAVWADELKKELLHERVAASEAKIVGRDGAGDLVQRWRGAGFKVGFTNGVFDLLHPGHVGLLKQARTACDRLVVGVNSDASVRRLKGKDRPIQDEAARATVLASLASVDAVVVFGEDTPIELIKALKPDLLVKGADYTVDKVVGAAEVKSWGGKVLLADLAAGHSTTGLVGRAAGKR